MEKKYESEALMVCHQSAEALYRLGVIDADEMREFDEGCLAQEPEAVNAAESALEMKHAIA